ncbi:hypothetical protein [Nigerium massiliense]|uniref:hypothetical protein n=1 Tax=Nigerium massiliense TaxID=1522317 RepID=UPI0011C772B3|nr:hypothetical protein [Nigerium massiliense]
MAFSVVSFFSVAGLSRNSSAVELASVIAAYSLESIAVSFANARWASLLVFREAEEPKQGDITHMTRAFLVTAAVGLPVFFLGAFLVERSWWMGLWAAVWSTSMLFGDMLRYAGSRFLGARVISAIGLAHVLAAVGFTFIIPPNVATYLAVLSLISLLAGVAYLVALRRHRRPGRSQAWARHAGFGRSMASEAVMTSAATGLGGAAVTWLNPFLAVGLQLGNQVLGMPATVLAQSFALPLSRRLRERMDSGRYPTKLLTYWAVFALAVPVLGVIALLVLRPLIYLLLGERADLAYYFLPVVFLQAAMTLAWQPFTSARRWTHGPDNPRRHVVVTVAVYYVLLVGVAALVHDQGQILLLLVVGGSVITLSTFVRAVVWGRDGRNWSGVDASVKPMSKRTPGAPRGQALPDNSVERMADDEY